MPSRYRKLMMAAWLILALPGCTDAVSGAARSSLAGFLTSIFSAAVSGILLQ
jgi:hypothetical protein